MENKKLIFSSYAAKLYLYEKSKIIEIKWNPQNILNIDLYKEPFNKIIELAKENKITYILSDTRKQGIVSHSAKQWFKREFLKNVKAYNVKKIAIVNNTNLIKNYYTNAISKILNQKKINTKVFNDYKNALKWLLKNINYENKNLYH